MASTKKNTNTNASTETTEKRTRSNKPVTLSSVVNTVATRKGADPTKTGKRVRAYIRAHDADLRKSFKWPPSDKERADGNRYPAMPRKCAQAIISKLG